jgi:hypothetical protein
VEKELVAHLHQLSILLLLVAVAAGWLMLEEVVQVVI